MPEDKDWVQDDIKKFGELWTTIGLDGRTIQTKTFSQLWDRVEALYLDDQIAASPKLCQHCGGDLNQPAAELKPEGGEDWVLAFGGLYVRRPLL